MIEIFDIMGPIMVGPSSSHTAGAVRIGRMARALLADEPKTVRLFLHGSFADTGVGHGTDRALIAGLLGMGTDDLAIPHSFELAAERGLDFAFSEMDLRDAHPNSVYMELQGAAGKKLSIQACSVGGGRILVNKIDGVDLEFSGNLNTLIIRNVDSRGLLANVTSALSLVGVNVANMSLSRNKKGGVAMMIIEIDEKVPASVLDILKPLPGILDVTYYEKED